MTIDSFPYFNNNVYFVIKDGEVCLKMYDPITSKVNISNRPPLKEIVGFNPMKDPKVDEKESKKLDINKVIFNEPAVIVFFGDGDPKDKVVSVARDDDPYDPLTGLLLCMVKRAYGKNVWSKVIEPMIDFVEVAEELPDEYNKTITLEPLAKKKALDTALDVLKIKQE